MNVLLCSTGFLPANAYGGVPYSTFSLCKALTKAGADVRVLTTDRNGADRLDVATDCWTHYEGVPVWYAKAAPGPFLLARSSTTVLAEIMPTVHCVISSGTLWVHSGVLAWRAARRHGKPAITYPRGLLDPWAMQLKRLQKQLHWRLWGKRILRDSAVIVALTDNERQSLRDLGVTTRIEVIPNGAAIAGQSDWVERDVVDATFPTVSGRRYILFLGRVHEKKGIDVLLPAIAELLAAKPETAFVLAGPIDAGYAARFHELLRANSLEGRVVLAGTVGGALKTALLQHAHLFVLPSYSEGLPVAVLEALFSGCPVVITKQCNVPEVERAKAGFVIDPDRRQLVSAVTQILDDDALREQMAARARWLATESFDWNVIGERTVSLCREVTRHPAGQPPV
jgi:glycosyltransferase involved in cell wall biosynthesis